MRSYNQRVQPPQESLQHARETDKAIRAAKGQDPSTSEAIIVADTTTPYRLLIEPNRHRFSPTRPAIRQC